MTNKLLYLTLLTFVSCSSVTYEQGYDNRTGMPYTKSKRRDLGRDTVAENMIVENGFQYSVGQQNESESLMKLFAELRSVIMTYSAEKTIRNNSDNNVKMNDSDNKADSFETLQKQRTSRHFESEKTKREAIEIIPEVQP